MLIYALLADLILFFHLALVIFNGGGFVVIWIGYFLKWSFIRNFWFRTIHLISMGIVALEALGGLMCPITVWEEKLRQLAGGASRYSGSFVAYWIHKIMFFDLPAWFFTVGYVMIFLLIVLSFIVIPPRRPRFLRRPKPAVF